MKEEKIKIYHKYRCPALDGKECNCHEPNPSFYEWTEDELKARVQRNTLEHFNSDKPYTEKDEAERVSLIMSRAGQCNGCTGLLAGSEHCKGTNIGCFCVCGGYEIKPVCVQCNQSGHSTCNKD